VRNREKQRERKRERGESERERERMRGGESERREHFCPRELQVLIYNLRITKHKMHSMFVLLKMY
jgi:hypothetical protein